MTEYFVCDRGVICPIYGRKSSPFLQNTGYSIRVENHKNYISIQFVDEVDEGRVDQEYVLHQSLISLN